MAQQPDPSAIEAVTPNEQDRQRALTDELAQRIQNGIMTGQFPPGSRLRQEWLAAHFGVSRTPIREALRQLQAAGIVEVTPRKGAFVHGPSARGVREAYTVRAELEGLAAELAAELITDAQLDQLREAERLFRVAVEHARHSCSSTEPGTLGDAQWPQANDLFHEVILEAAGNRLLRETIDHLHLSLPRNLTWPALHGNSRLLLRNVREHAEIRQAIDDHRPAMARKAMRRHVQRSGDLVARQFEAS